MMMREMHRAPETMAELMVLVEQMMKAIPQKDDPKSAGIGSPP